MNTDRLQFRVWQNGLSYRRDFLIDCYGNILYQLRSGEIWNFNHHVELGWFSIEHSTGIKDCAGTLIFEGDIVEYLDHCTGERNLGAIVLDDYKPRITGFEGKIESVHCRIIGNIHEGEENVDCIK